jgi:hypothetical protein
LTSETDAITTNGRGVHIINMQSWAAGSFAPNASS